MADRSAAEEFCFHTVPLGFDNCYLLLGDDAVLVDGGAPGQLPSFERRLAELDVSPTRIKLIVLTHTHWDHIGSVADLVKRTGARLAVHRSEQQIVERGQSTMPPGCTWWGRVFSKALGPVVRFIEIEPARVDVAIDDDGMSLEPFGVPGRVVHTPGHSPGSLSVLLDSGAAFVGDMAMNAPPLRLSPGLPIFAEEPEKVAPSWRRLLEHDLETIYPAHGKPFPAAVMKDEVGPS